MFAHGLGERGGTEECWEGRDINHAESNPAPWGLQGPASNQWEVLCDSFFLLARAVCVHVIAQPYTQAAPSVHLHASMVLTQRALCLEPGCSRSGGRRALGDSEAL